jgi:hypothetical protein
MPDINSLASRVDAEFSAAEEKVKKFQAEQVREHQRRQQRLQQLTRLFDELRTIWGPRLEVLVKKFGERVKVTPRLIPSTREATFDFQSSVARVRLKFSATTDRDVQKVILSYDLEIIPILMQFQPHADLVLPLESVDPEVVAKWIEDRIVDFVRTYLSMGENEVYFQDQMVEDPLVHVRFPKFAASSPRKTTSRSADG